MKNLFSVRLLTKSILACLLLAFTNNSLEAQSITSYSFANSTTTFTTLTSPTTVSWTGNNDDAISGLVPIGFDFWYMGTRYTTVSASTNGWMTLGTAATDPLYTNSLTSSGAPRPIIAPLWDDLDISANTNVTYKTTGTEGSRIFTIQYLNMKWYYLASGSVISFQAKLYESTGKIEFIYRPENTSVSSPSASIGITATATGSGNFLSVSNAGTSVSSATEANVTTKPASGKRYAFTPPVPTAPGSLTFSNVGSTAMTLQWTDLSSNEAGFAIYRSTDGINYTFVSQVAAGTTSSVQSGLTVNTTYYWKVYAVSVGALSTALNGSQATTTCPGPNISNIPTANLILHYKFNGNANDIAGSNNGTLQNAPATTADRFGHTTAAYSFNGTNQYVSTTNSFYNPDIFTMSVWFKTTTTSGGLLMGFGSSQTGTSISYDRNIYMNNAGQIYFGCNPTGGNATAVSSSLSYNDNTWHLVTATLSGSGMILYIDGAEIASNASITSGQNFTGYWRIGFDNVQWWPSAPSSNYFNGSLDDALIYHAVLTPTQVATLYNAPDGAGSDAPVCAGSSLSFSATTVSNSTYAWTGPNGFTSSLQNPTLIYSAAYAGVYQVEVTAAGCATPAVAYVKVESSATTGQWTGNVSTDWANGDNWCEGVVPTSATDVIIAATATNMPAISSSVSCRNLTINSGATITLNNSGTLNIAGTLANSGTFTNNGTVQFNGTSGQQTFSGVSSFYNLTLDNASGLLLPATITVNNNLTITAGILTANSFNISVKGNWINNSGTAAFAAGTGIVTFNNTATQTIGGVYATTFNHLTIVNSGSIVTLNVNASITGNLTVSSGTLDLSTFTANRATTGGTLIVSNNATLKIGGTNTYPTNYTTNTLVVASTIEYSGTNQTVANQSYGNLKLSGASGSVVKTFPGTTLTVVGNLSSVLGTCTALSFTAAANITVNGNVSIGASTTFNGGSYVHNIGGNWVNNGTFNGNTGTVTFNGVGTSISGSGTQNFNNLTVTASSVSFSSGSITLTGNLATTGAGSFSQVSGSNLLMTGTAKTINGSGISLDNLTVNGSVNTASPLSITGNLSVPGSFTSTGTVTMSGASKTITGAGTLIFAALSATGSITTNTNFSISSGLVVNGSLSASAGTATFTGTSTLSGAPNLFNININGTSLQLSANATLGIANTMTITSGNLNVTTSTPNTVNFNGSGDQNINAITYCNLVLSNGNTKTASGSITTTNDITIGAGTTLNPSSYTLSIYGDWTNNGTFTPATSTVEFLGSATAFLTGATTFNVLTSNTSNATTQLFLNNNVSAAIVNMTSGIINTESNTITITNTRTGPGFIYGNIQRTHAFITGVPYAFEGPDNTITFSAVSSVSNITVSITEGTISDFPFGGSISRVYNITVPAGTYTASLRFHYEDDELNGNSESSMGLWQYSGSAWGNIGKTANSTTSNYIEQSGLTNITNRWTCSDDGNVVQWNGSVSTDWNTAANWTVIQGAATAPPSVTDIVNLGTVAFTHQPAISDAVSVKNINFGSVQAVTLSMGSGGSLTSGDINGAWSSNVTHTINANNQSITINGDLNLSDGTSGHKIDLNIGTGTVTVAGSLSETGQANISFNGNGVLNIAENFHYINGTFTPGSGTVIYNGPADQHIAHIGYNHLTLNKAGGIVLVDSVVNIAGNLLISSGELDNASIINSAGNVTISSGATLENSNTLYVGGNWANSGNYVGIGAQIIFNGSGTQTISATTFNNLVINKPVGSTAELTGNVALNGDLTITSGALDVKSFICDRSVPGGAITLADSGTFIIGGNNPPINFTNGLITNSSTVILDGTVPQTIVGGVAYGNIILRNTGVKTLFTPLTLNGNLTIENGATFNADSSTITLYGNWANSGTFIPSTGTIICAGSAKTLSGNTTFNRVTVTGSYTLLGNMTFNGLLNITSTGSFSAGGTILTTMNGDLINSGVLYTLGTTTFTGNVVQTLSLINAVNTVALKVNFNGSVSPVLNSTSVPQFGYITINNTGGVHPSVDWTILYSLAVGSGATFDGGPSTHNILGAVTNNGTISSSGTLNFIPSTAVPINLGSNFSSTGTVNFGGAGAMTITGTPISFHNVVISNTNVAGITPSSNWTLTHDLTINSGTTLHGGNYSWLVGGNILNNGTLNSETSTFTLNGTGIQNVLSASAFNNFTVNKAAGSAMLSSNLTVNSALNFIAGIIHAGSNSLIQPSTGTVTGAAQNTGWVDGRLQKNIVTGATNKTFEIGDATNYTPVSVAFTTVTTAGDLTASATAGDHPAIASSTINTSETVNRFWTLTNNGISFTDYNATFNYAAADVDPGANTGAYVIGKYNGNIWSYPVTGTAGSNSLQATGLTSFEDFQIGRMLIFAKTWDGGAGTNNWGDAQNWNTDGVPTASDYVELTGANTINIDVAATTKNLLLENASLVLTTTAGNSLTVSGDMTINNGTFNTAAAFPSVSGTLAITGGTIGFTGSIPQTIPAYNYYNLTCSSTGSRTFAGTGTITIAGTFTAGTNAYTVAGSTVDFNGGGAQSIPAIGYNNLTLSNAGVKTFEAGTAGIAGTLSVTGTAIAKATTNHATIRYNGSANQTIAAITYYGLDISSTGGIVSGTDPALTDFYMSSGTLDLNTSTLAIPGTAIFTSGIINNGTVSATGEKTLFAGTTFEKSVNAISDSLYLNGSTFNDTAVFTKTGTADIVSSGGNIFNATAAITNNGTGLLRLGNTTADDFNSDVTFSQTGSGLLQPAYDANTTIAGNLSAAGTAAITFGTVTLDGAAMQAIESQHSPTFNNLTIANSGNTVALGVSTTITGDLSVISGTLDLDSFTADRLTQGGSMTISDGATLKIGGAYTMPANYNAYSLGTTSIVEYNGNNQNVAPLQDGEDYGNLIIAGPGTKIEDNVEVRNDFSITSGSLNLNTYSLAIGGAISNGGTFTAYEGTIELNGSVPQAIPASTFSDNRLANLSINNTSGVTLEGTLNLAGALLSNGPFNTGGYLTLLSTDTQTALIDGSGTGEVLGNVTMQRYISSGFGYKYFSSPFQAANVSEFSDEVDLNASFPSFYKYDESLASSGWVKYMNAADTLVPMQGYAARLDSSAAAQTVDITGVVNNNTLTVDLYNHNQLYTLGFNLIGNPYPSPIDWNIQEGWDRTNIDDAVYYFNAGSDDQYKGTYSSYINGISSDEHAGSVIPAMQGFFVHVSNGTYPVTGSLSVNNNARVNDLHPYFHKPESQITPLLRLNAGFADENPESDPVVIYFDHNGQSTFNKEMDALKLMNSDPMVPNLYVNALDATMQSICAWPYLKDTTDVIPLGLRTQRAGWVTFSAPAIDGMLRDRQIYLYDAKTRDRHILDDQMRYRLYLDAGDYENRFFLMFNETQFPGTEGVFNVYAKSGTLCLLIAGIGNEKCDVAITNVQGQVVSRRQFAGDGHYIIESPISSGIYIVSFYVKQHVFSQKIFIGK